VFVARLLETDRKNGINNKNSLNSQTFSDCLPSVSLPDLIKFQLQYKSDRTSSHVCSTCLLFVWRHVREIELLFDVYTTPAVQWNLFALHGTSSGKLYCIAPIYVLWISLVLFYVSFSFWHCISYRLKMRKIYLFTEQRTMNIECAVILMYCTPSLVGKLSCANTEFTGLRYRLELQYKHFTLSPRLSVFPPLCYFVRLSGTKDQRLDRFAGFYEIPYGCQDCTSFMKNISVTLVLTSGCKWVFNCIFNISRPAGVKLVQDTGTQSSRVRDPRDNGCSESQNYLRI